MKTKAPAFLRVRQLLTLGILSFFLTLASSCSKDDDSNPDPGPKGDTPSQIPGMGDFGGTLQGDPYSFPGGVSLVDTLRGFNNTDDTVYATVGRGSFVDVYCVLYNSGNAVRWDIPGGLTFASLDSADQNGICAETNSVMLPAHDTVVVLIQAYCLNSSKHPSGDKFSLGPVTNSSSMKELVGLLKNKNVPSGEGSVVQHAVWSITDGNGLNSINRQEIAALPNK